MTILMIKILNKIFGWHYILISFGFGHALRRVKQLPNGAYYVNLHNIILLKDTDREVIPLTYEGKLPPNKKGA